MIKTIEYADGSKYVGEIINEMKILNEDFNLNAKKFIFLNSQGRLINHNLLNIYIKKTTKTQIL